MFPIYGTSFLQGCISVILELDRNKMGKTCKGFEENESWLIEEVCVTSASYKAQLTTFDSVNQ